MMSLVVAALMLISAPQNEGVAEVDRLLEPCLAAAEEAYRKNDSTIIDRFIEKMASDREANRDRMMLCLGYFRGSQDTVLKRDPVSIAQSKQPVQSPPVQRPTQPEAKQVSPVRPSGSRRAAVKGPCWQDYCPCEPPQGGPDMGICRQLRAGIRVDPEILAAAAMMRDARKQMDDFGPMR